MSNIILLTNTHSINNYFRCKQLVFSYFRKKIPKNLVHKEITSLQNPFIKELIAIKERSRSRKRTGLFFIEGRQEISLAIQGGYQINTLIYCEDIFDANKLSAYTIGTEEIIKVSPEVYQRIAYRDSTQGLIAIAEMKTLSLEDITFNNNTPLVLVAEAPEKPGNIGALLRTADAAKADAVLIANPKTDMYNPNIIRSSVGCIFTNQIATGTTGEIIEFFKKQHINLYCAVLSASKPYYSIDFRKASAIIVGTEHDGLSDQWLQNATQNIIIPMQGRIDSLNVSVSAAILIFEAKRQRNFQ